MKSVDFDLPEQFADFREVFIYKIGYHTVFRIYLPYGRKEFSNPIKFEFWIIIFDFT